MSETTVDLGRKNSVLSEGVHHLRIKKCEEKQGPKGPYWNFLMECTDPGPDLGVGVFTIVSLAPDARWKLDQFLDGVGAPDKGTVVGSKFVGKDLRAMIKYETYNGAVKSVVEAYIPGNAPEGTVPKVSGTGNTNPTPPTELPETTGQYKAPF
jgi:hypothetical protein